MEKTKKQVLPSGLWVVATPIGNLQDITERARAALEQADGILCEDTRETSKLLHALGIDRGESRLFRFDAHASDRTVAKALERLAAGESLALVTDAGTPAISDPGALLVAAAREAGVRVTPLPGASAVMTLLSACGFMETAFVFGGFFARKTGERRAVLDRARGVAELGAARVFVWFESPHRIVESLEAVRSLLPSVHVVAAKELSKVHEKFFSGTAEEAASAVKNEIEREGALGEWCFAIRFPEESVAATEGISNGSDWVKALQCLMDCRVPASEAARQVSQHFGIQKKVVYERALRISGKKVDPGY